MEPRVVNIAAYRFVPLGGLAELRRRLLSKCKGWGLKGTILLSPEGINLFVAGGREPIDCLLAEIRGLAGLEDFEPKESLSREQPFRRMLVRIKREIIAFGVAGIDPARRTSPKVAPGELKRWLDEGRPLTLLDTRNDYEVKLGTFEGAVTLGLDHFRNFPAAVERLPEELKSRPIVMFCTGGIRCEKAGPYMERAGFQNVVQLEGGILKYFEECGGAHYRGECFVFDQRVGLDPSLAETASAVCFNCLTPLTSDDQADPRYVPGKSCPACHATEQEQMARTIARRHEAIARATSPLPGSEPYDNDRPVSIAAEHDGRTLLETLCRIFPHLPAEHWLERFGAGLILDAERRPAEPDRRVAAGERFLHRMPAVAEPEVNAAIRIIYEDGAIVVVDKPAPLPLHPSGRFNRNTLQWILNEVYRPQRLRPVHRLDANTTGVVVLARTRGFAGRLQGQFEAGRVEKVYVARVEGRPRADEFVCEARIGERTTALGGRAVEADGLWARSEFRVLRAFDDGSTLLEARPITGRTNQLRLHLAHMGHPVRGDQAYGMRGEAGAAGLSGAAGGRQTHRPDDPPLCLHAARITIEHPLTGRRQTFVSAEPAWSERGHGGDGS